MVVSHTLVRTSYMKFTLKMGYFVIDPITYWRYYN